jgi:hypothetical protein
MLVLAVTTGIGLACGSFSEDTTPLAPVEGGTESSVVGDERTVPPDAPCDPQKTASDPLHCGRCNHSCLGGACDASVCKPVVVATTAEGVNDLVVDAQNIFWMTALPGAWAGQGHLYRVAS